MRALALKDNRRLRALAVALETAEAEHTSGSTARCALPISNFISEEIFS
jgi:hypothetical protein